MAFLVPISSRALVITLAAAAAGLSACGDSAASGTPAPGGTPTPSGSQASGPPAAGATVAAPTFALESSPPGDIPDTTAYRPVTPPGAPFTISVPEGWAQGAEQGVTTFTEHFHTIRLAWSAASSAPTADSFRSAELPALAKGELGFSLKGVTTVQRKSGPALLATYLAVSTPDPVTGKSIQLAVERYEFWHNGTETVVTLSGGAGDDNVDPWRTVTDSLTWR